MNPLKVGLAVIPFVGIALLLAAGTDTAVAAGSFIVLDPPPGEDSSVATAVSYDGRVVVGYSTAHGVQKAVRWVDGVPEFLDEDGYIYQAHSVSSDGTVIVGETFSTYAWRWENNSWTILPLLPGTTSGYALDISGDGSIIVGTNGGGSAVRWVNGVVEALGGGRSAQAVSSDGTTITGFYFPSTPFAFRWKDGLLISLGSLNSGTESQARGISADGRYVVGVANNGVTGKAEAFLWETTTGMIALGLLSGRETDAKAVSADGSIVIGNSLWPRAFIWDAHSGIRDLKDVLTNEYGLPVPLSWLYYATDISPDGETIVGWGAAASGAGRAWIARVPPSPSNVSSLSSISLAALSLALLAIGLASGRLGRRARP